MNWQDEGFLLSKIKFRENGSIIRVFTNNYGKMSGIVYGGNSRKIRNYLQLVNKIFVFYKSKGDNRIGYFKTELVEPISPKYFNDKKRTTALLSLTSILNVLLPESQPNKKIFNSVNELLKNFSNQDWILLYIYWELSLIKELGYDTNLENFIDRKEINSMVTVEIDKIVYQVPFFLINKNLKDINTNLIRKALNFTRSVMLNKFFIPNSLIYPKARVLLENYFN